MEKKLQRDEQHKTIAGVCAGLAEYLNIDVTLVRVLFVVSLVLHGCGIIPYIVLWIVLPKKVYGFTGTGFNPGPVDYTVPPQSNGPADYSVPNPFANFTPGQQSVPFTAPPKKRSNAAIIVGVALVAFGSFFLLDNFDLLPDWQFDRLWPVVIIAAGVVLVFIPQKQNPWEKAGTPVTEQPLTETKQEDKTEDTPPTV